MQKGRTYVVVPVHNRVQLTQKLLSCLAEQRATEFTIIVIDDGSTDGTKEMIQSEFPEVSLLSGDGTLFWTGAVNLGLKHLLENARDDDFVLLLNDDLEFDPDYVSTIIDLARKHKGALVGSVVVDIDHPEIIFDGGLRINWWTAKYTYLNQHRPLSSFPLGTIFDVSTLTGRGVVIPVSVFREIGLYDEVNFRHRGDIELPVRAWQKGSRLLVAYDAVVRCHTERTYALHAKGKYRLSDLPTFFFDFRSFGALGVRYHFARKTVSGTLQRSCFLSLDIARLVVHVLRRLTFG